MARGSRVRIEQVRPVRERAAGYESINQAPAFAGSNVGPAPSIVTVDGDYMHAIYEVAYRGATQYVAGTGIYVKELSDFNSVLAPHGLSFPGGIYDDNNWQVPFRMPSNYDSSRLVYVTLNIIQEAT